MAELVTMESLLQRCDAIRSAAEVKKKDPYHVMDQLRVSEIVKTIKDKIAHLTTVSMEQYASMGTVPRALYFDVQRYGNVTCMIDEPRTRNCEDEEVLKALGDDMFACYGDRFQIAVHQDVYPDLYGVQFYHYRSDAAAPPRCSGLEFERGCKGTCAHSFPFTGIFRIYFGV